MTSNTNGPYERTPQESDEKTGESLESFAAQSMDKNERADDAGRPRCDEGRIVVEAQYVAEAVAFLAFEDTAPELNTATKELAEIVLGRGWLTDRKKRKNLPGFVKDELGLTLAKSAEKVWSVSLLLPFLNWLASQHLLTTFGNEHENVIVQRDMFQAIVESVKNMTLFDVWRSHRPVPRLKEIVREMETYRSVLLKLECEDAVRCVEEKTTLLTELIQKEDLSTSVLNKKLGVTARAKTVEMAVVFKAFHHVEQCVYEFCRDNNIEVSYRFGAFLQEKEQAVGLPEMLDFISGDKNFLNSAVQEKISELRSSIEAVSKTIVQHQPAVKLRKPLFTFLQSCEKLMEVFQWKSVCNEQKTAEILKLLDRFQVKEESRSGTLEQSPSMVVIHTQLNPVLPRKLHHWIRPNREEFVGRKEMLSEICGLLENRAGKVLITGPSGIGKSTFAREAAYRLRTAWPTQFVLDMSTCFSKTADISNVTTHYGLLSEVSRSEAQTTEIVNNFLHIGSGNRLLLVVENCNSNDSVKLLEIPEREDVSLIIVTRQCGVDLRYSGLPLELIDLMVYLTPFSSKESGQKVAELAGGGTSGEVHSVKELLLYCTNNFPVAIQVANCLLLHSLKYDSLGGLQSFARNIMWSQGNMISSDELADLVFSSRNASAVSTVVQFAMNLLERQHAHRMLVYMAAILAQPTAPLLFFESGIAKDVQEKVLDLQALGLVLLEPDEKGQPFSLRMHASVSRVIQSIILNNPIEGCTSIFTKCIRKLCHSLHETEKMETAAQFNVACSATCFAQSDLFQRVYEKAANSSSQCLDKISSWHAVLNSALAEVVLRFVSHATHAMPLEYSFDFFVKSLELLSSVGDEGPFWVAFRCYVDAMFSHSGKRQAERMNYMMTLALTGGTNQNVVLITDDNNCGYAALHFSHIASQAGEQDSDWEPLYASHPDFEHLRSKALRSWMIRSKALSLLRKSRRKEAINLLLFNLSDAEESVEEDSTSYGKTLNLLAPCCLLEGDKVRARKYYTDALHSLEGGERNQVMVRNILECLTNLGSPALLDASKPDVSRGYLQQALTLAKEVYGEGHEDVIKIVCIMANVEYTLGNFTKVRKLRQRIPSHLPAISEDQTKIFQAAEELCTPGQATASRGGKKKKKRMGQAATKESDTQTGLQEEKKKEDTVEVSIEYPHDDKSKQCVPQPNIGESHDEGNFPPGTEKPSKPTGLEKDEEKTDVAEPVIECSDGEESQHEDLESEGSASQGMEESDKPAVSEKEERREYPTEAVSEDSHDDESKQGGREPTFGESHGEGSFPPGKETINERAGSEKKAEKEDIVEDITEPVVEDPCKEESTQQESEVSTAEGLEEVAGAEEQSREEEAFSDDQTTDDEEEETKGQLRVVLGIQDCAEAVAFLSFKKTASELEKAAKKVAQAILGPGWISDKRKRKELPVFVKDNLKKVSQNSPVPVLGVVTVLYLLVWLANKSVRWQLIEDEEEQQAVKICQSIVNKVANISLFDVWLNDFPAPSPENIILELNEYKTILTTLGCEKAVPIFEDTTGWLFDEVEKSEFSRGASKEKDVSVQASVVEMAVVFKAFHFVEEFVFDFCRDSNTNMSRLFAISLEEKKDDGHTNLHANLDFIQAQEEPWTTPQQISGLRSSLTDLCQYFVDELKPSRKTRIEAVFSFWKRFRRFKKSLRWDSCRHEQERLYIGKLLRRYVKDDVSEHVEPINILIPSQLRPVLPRKRHHWIAPNKETFAERKKELDQICGLLEKQAGTVLITGSSGIGKSSFAREAAFRLRSAWPSQFVLDMSTPFSLSASLAEMANFYKFKDAFQIADNVRTYDFAVLSMFNDFIKQCGFRILVVLENLDSVEALESLKQTYQEEVTIVIVSREFQTSTTRREHLIDLTISLENFSLEDAKECFKSLKGIEMTKEQQELERFMLALTNNFPLAVHIAGKLLLHFPDDCASFVEDFVGSLSQSDQEGVTPAGWSPEIASSENTNAVYKLVMFALDLIEHETDLEDFVYMLALLARPTVPVLPSLFSMGDSAADFEDTLESLLDLENFGVLFEEEQEGGHYICFGMQPLVSQIVLSKMLTLPLSKCFKLFSQCVKTMRRHLTGDDGPEDLNPVVRGHIACSTALLDQSGIFERLCEKTAGNIGLRRQLFVTRGRLLFALGQFFGSFDEHSSVVVSPESSCKFYARALAIASHLEEKVSFLEYSHKYIVVIWRSIPCEVLAKMMNQLLVLSITSGKGDGVMVEDERAGYMATQFALAAGRVKDFDWAELYFSFAEEVTNDINGYLTLIQEQNAFYMKESMLDKAEQRLYMYMNKMEKTYGKNAFMLGTCLRYLGQVYLQRGEKEPAKTFFLDTMKRHEPFRGQPQVEMDVLNCLLYLGSAELLDKSKPYVSRGYLNKALTLVSKFWKKGSEQYCMTLAKFAELEDALGNNWKAEEFRQSIPTQFAHLAKPKVSQTESDSSLSSVTTVSTSAPLSGASPTKSTKTGKKKKKKKKKSKASVEEQEGDSSH